jgi:uncharacterized protein
MQNQVFINLAVNDLEKSTNFFTKLGFKFNEHFADETANCLIIGNNIYITLIAREYFGTFTNKAVCDSRQSAEVIITLAVESREKVDELVDTALTNGGMAPHPTQEYSWIYSRSFEDIDGHVWEVMYLNTEMLNLN